jgi:hypothetical protein
MRVSEGHAFRPVRLRRLAAAGGRRLAARCGRIAREEDGKVAIVSIFVVAAIALMIGFVTNLGLVARDRIRLQNAADAAASSTALWMARAVNGVTATNHMMGEMTALLAALEGFGGPLLGSGQEVFSAESEKYNNLITGGSSLVPMMAGKLPSTIALAVKDKPFVSFVTRIFTADKGRHGVGAALYDGRMMLKFCVFLCYGGKKIGNVVMKLSLGTTIAPTLSVGLENAATFIHQAMNIALGKCLQEWFALAAIEKMAAGIKATQLPARIESQLIPALSLHADSVVGSGVAASLGQGASPMNRAIRTTLERLADEHGVTSLDTAPSWEAITLPLEREPPPPAEQGSAKEHGPWEQPPIAWSGDFESVFMREILRPVRATGDAAGLALQPVKAFLKLWEGAEKAGLQAPPGLDAVKNALDEAVAELDKLREALANVPKPEGFPGNPLLDEATPAEFRLPAFHWQVERQSQWVRATHPYVDDYRSSVVHLLRAVAPISNTATFYVHWTDRFTLAKSFAIRTRADRPCHMHVLRGSTADTKGNEPWTTDGAAAERLFCVAAVATGKAPPAIMTEVFFRMPSGSRQAVSQAMLYNATGRTEPPGGGGLTQPATGWDTLNWRPPVVAWEWGDHPPSKAAGNLTGLLGGSKPAAKTDRVMLNWRTKLVPVNPDFIRGVAPPAMKPFVDRLQRDRGMLAH